MSKHNNRVVFIRFLPWNVGTHDTANPIHREADNVRVMVKRQFILNQSWVLNCRLVTSRSRRQTAIGGNPIVAQCDISCRYLLYSDAINHRSLF